MSFDYKNASKKELQIEYKRIAEKIGDDEFFTKKELNYLPEILTNDEEIIAFSSGLMDGNTWLITLTDKRIIFLDKGMIYGLKQTVINLDKINSISGQTGIIFGEIFIEDGAQERHIDNVWKKTVKPFTNLVMEAIENHRNKLNTPQVIQQQVTAEDPYEKLEKLAGLKDKGIISEDEFNTAKQKLLRL
jgi:hypothetical protein